MADLLSIRPTHLPDYISSVYLSKDKYMEWIDSQFENKVINIIGFDFSPSIILFSMDEDAFNEGLENFISDYYETAQEELRDNIINSYPFPISHPYYKFMYGYTSQHDRLLYLRDVWESMVYFLFAICIMEVTARDINLNNFNTGQIFTSRIHAKLLIISQILDLCNTMGNSLSLSNLIDEKIIEEMIRLNGIRNGFSHSGTLSSFQVEQIISEEQSEVENILYYLRLDQYQLLRYATNEGAINVIRCEAFEGQNITRRHISLDINGMTLLPNTFTNEIVLAKFGTMIFNVSPFIHFQETQNGHETNICYLKRKLGELSTEGSNYVFENRCNSSEFGLPTKQFQRITDFMIEKLGTN